MNGKRKLSYANYLKKLIFKNYLEWLIYSTNSIKFNFLILIDHWYLFFSIRNIFSIIIIYRIRYINLNKLINKFLYLIILYIDFKI